MIDLRFVQPELVHLLWPAAAIVIAIAWLEGRGRDALARFLSATMQERLVDRPTLGRRIARLAAIAATLALAVLALMRPQSRGATEETPAAAASAEIMVLLDVSKSMLAEDVAPNRLGRARAEIRELVRELPGHRVGLIAFAGRPSVLCPMTPDRGFFRLVLETASPASVTRGGTRIGEAIRKAVAGFSPGEGAKLIVLFTDGEDHDSYPLDAAKEALARGVRIVAIGFGDEAGSEIPITDPKTGSRAPLRDRAGSVVVSRLDGATLREVAVTTEGAYVPAGTGVLDLESIVRRHVDPMIRAESAPAVRTVAAERYQWFLLGAMGALLAAVLAGSRVGASPRRWS